MSSLSLRIERIDPLTPHIRRLILVATGPAPLPAFTPGAHLELQIPGTKPLWRAYSLVNLPGQDHRVMQALGQNDAAIGDSGQHVG